MTFKADLDLLTAVVVNDDVTQLKLLTGLLKKAGIFSHTFETAGEALQAMDTERPPDLIVTDLYMPENDGWRFCRLLRSPEYAAFNEVPIIVVSATFAGDEVSRITADLGANAFLSSPVDGIGFIKTVKTLLSGEQPKNQLRILIVEDSRSQANLIRKSFEQQGCHVVIAINLTTGADLLENETFDVAVIDYHLPDGKGDSLLTQCRNMRSDLVCIMMTTDPNPELALEWMQKGAAAYLHKPFEPGYLLELCARTRREKELLRMEDLLEMRTRELRESRDILKAKSMEQRLLLDGIKTQVWYLSDVDTYGRVNRAHSEFLGFHSRDIAYKKLEAFLSPEFAAVCRASNKTVFKTRKSVYKEEWLPNVTGENRLIEIIKKPRLNAAGEVEVVVCTGVDITERRQAETEKEKLQAQLLQAQKMEAIGTLAGGIAHDFNNMLGVILGHTELALEQTEEDQDIYSDLKEIQKAAQRSADLTKQLLTFARKQIIEPKMVSYSNSGVTNMCTKFVDNKFLFNRHHII